MGLQEDPRTRNGLIASMEDVYLKQWIFLNNISAAVLERFGSAGGEALWAGITEFGLWRGEYIRNQPAVIVSGRDVSSLIQNWDAGDLALAALKGPVSVSRDEVSCTVELPEMPGLQYFTECGSVDTLYRYWELVTRGIAEGYSAIATAAILDLPSSRPWRTQWHVPSILEGDTRVGKEPPEFDSDAMQIFERPVDALRLIQRTSQNSGSLYFHLARSVIRAFDASGEQAIREGVRRIGRERGSVIRERHLAAGKELTMSSLMNDWDGPLVSVWNFRDEGYLSDGVWHQDCTHCPYAEAWAGFGKEGQELGYLYDVELHTEMFQTYHPGAMVRWDALKTRGDQLCKFRFTIPELMSPGELQEFG